MYFVVLYFPPPVLSLSRLRSDYSFTAPVNLLTFYPRAFLKQGQNIFLSFCWNIFTGSLMKYFLSRFHALHKIVERKLMKLFSVNSMFLIFHCPEETSKTRRAATTNITTHPPHHPPAFCMNQIVAELCCGGWKFDFLFLLSPLSPLRFA